MFLQEASGTERAHAVTYHEQRKRRISLPDKACDLRDVTDKTLSAVSVHKAEILGCRDAPSVTAIIVYNRNKALLGKIVHERKIAFLMLVHAMYYLYDAVYARTWDSYDSVYNKLIELRSKLKFFNVSIKHKCPPCSN